MEELKLRRGGNATTAVVVCRQRKGADGNSSNEGIPGRKETTIKSNMCSTAEQSVVDIKGC